MGWLTRGWTRRDTQPPFVHTLLQPHTASQPHRLSTTSPLTHTAQSSAPAHAQTGTASEDGTPPGETTRAFENGRLTGTAGMRARTPCAPPRAATMCAPAHAQSADRGPHGGPATHGAQRGRPPKKPGRPAVLLKVFFCLVLSGRQPLGPTGCCAGLCPASSAPLNTMPGHQGAFLPFPSLPCCMAH